MPPTAIELSDAAQDILGTADGFNDLCSNADLLAHFWAYAGRALFVNELEFLACVKVLDGTAPAPLRRRAPLPGGTVTERLIWLVDTYVSDTAAKEVNIDDGGAQRALMVAAANGTIVLGDLARARNQVSVGVFGRIGTWRGELTRAANQERVAAGRVALGEIRKHQKGKIAGFKFFGGKHPAGKFVLYANSVDGAVLLVSSAINKDIDARYVTMMEDHLGGDGRVNGIWVQETKEGRKVFTIEGSSSDALAFGRALTAMGITADVESGNKRAVEQRIIVSAPKQAKLTEEAITSKEIDRQLKQDKPKLPTPTFQLLGRNQQTGSDTAEAAWLLAQPALKLISADLANLALTKFNMFDARLERFEKARTTGNYWMVLVADPKLLDQRAEAFIGLYFYRGPTKPAATVQPNKKKDADGWLPLITPADVMEKLLRGNNLL